MWDLIVSVPDHCLFFYFLDSTFRKNYIQSYCLRSGVCVCGGGGGVLKYEIGIYLPCIV